MLVEHTFVTTKDRVAVYSETGELLSKLGFTQLQPLDAGVIMFTRGKRKVEQAKRSDDLPQRVAIDFDRGRIQIAISIEQGRLLKKEIELQKEMLLSLVSLLESCVSRGELLEQARTHWDQTATKIGIAYHRRARISRITGLCFIALFAAIITSLMIFL